MSKPKPQKPLMKPAAPAAPAAPVPVTVPVQDFDLANLIFAARKVLGAMKTEDAANVIASIGRGEALLVANAPKQAAPPAEPAPEAKA